MAVTENPGGRTGSETGAQAGAEIAPGQRDEILGEAGVAAARDVENVVRLEQQGDRIGPPQRAPRDRCVRPYAVYSASY